MPETPPKSRPRATALALSTFGRLDILINNAGAGNYKNLIDTSVEEYDRS